MKKGNDISQNDMDAIAKRLSEIKTIIEAAQTDIPEIKQNREVVFDKLFNLLTLTKIQLGYHQVISNICLDEQKKYTLLDRKLELINQLHKETAVFIKKGKPIAFTDEALRYIINFNSDTYVLQNPDVKNAGVDPFQHFKQYGLREILLKKRKYEISDNDTRTSDTTYFCGLINSLENQKKRIEHEFYYYGAALANINRTIFEHYIEKNFEQANPDVVVLVKQGYYSSTYDYFVETGIEQVLKGERRLSLDDDYISENDYTQKNHIRTELARYGYSSGLELYLRKLRGEYQAVRGKVSVIIPTCNAAEFLPILLPTLLHQTGIADIEIIIIDSQSDDGTVEIINNYKNEKIKLIEIEKKNFSHSFARNLGAEQATGEYLIFLVQDALPINLDWARILVSELSRHGLVALSCIQSPRQNADLFSKFNIAHFNEFLETGGSTRIYKRFLKDDVFSRRKNSQIDNVSCLYRKETFDLYKFRGEYAEDLDIGQRLVDDGYKIGMTEETRVIHSHTRAPNYFMKRSYVDTSTLIKLKLHQPGHTFNLKNFNLDVLQSYRAVFLLYQAILGLNSNLNIVSFEVAVNEAINRCFPGKNAGASDQGCNLAIDQNNNIIVRLLEIIEKNDSGVKGKISAPYQGVLYHIVAHHISALITFCRKIFEIVEDDIKVQFAQSLIKHFYSSIGTIYAELEGAMETDDQYFEEFFTALKKGI